MKKFQFHLDKLLSYKGQVLESEMMALAVLNNQLQGAQQKLLKLKTDQEKNKRDFENKIMERTTPAACQLYLQYTDYIKEQIKLCEVEVKICTNKVEEQIEIIKKIMVETKSLDTLKTSKLEDYNKESIKISELKLEEFVSSSKIMVNSI